MRPSRNCWNGTTSALQREGKLLKAPRIHIYIYIYIYKLTTLVAGDPKVPFSIATTPRGRGES